MANTDQNTALPVRTEADGVDERLHVKIVDGTSPASNQMTVDGDKNAHVEVHGNDPGGADRVVRTSERGGITPDGVYDGTFNTKPGNCGVIASVRALTQDSTTQTAQVTSVRHAASNTTALDVSLHDSSGAPLTSTNPIPVTIVDAPAGESPIHDFIFTPADIAKAGTADLDYPVSSGKTLILKQILTAASGKFKAEIMTSPDGVTFTTRAVRFSSVAVPTADWTIPVPIVLVGTGAKVRVHVTNIDNQPQTIYATVVGSES